MRAIAARGADLMLSFEPVWAVPPLVVAMTGLLTPWPFLALAALSWPGRLARRGYLTARTPFDMPIALLLLGLLIGLYAAVDLQVGLQVVSSYMAAALLFYVVVNSTGTRFVMAWPALASLLLILLPSAAPPGLVDAKHSVIPGPSSSSPPPLCYARTLTVIPAKAGIHAAGWHNGPWTWRRRQQYYAPGLIWTVGLCRYGG